jgi:CRP-like cAMP-binding protein
VSGRLGDGDLARLAGLGRLQAIARGELLALDVPLVAIVVDGYFRIYRNAAFARDVTLGLASRGDVLGPGAAFGVRSAETGAQALGGGRVLMLTRDTWEREAATNPGLNVRMAGSVGRRLVRLQKRIEQFSRSGAEARVAAIVGELADDFGVPVRDGLKLELPFSQEDLARLAGTTRETTSSAVADLARAGIVRGGRLRGLLVLDREKLREAADFS